MPDITSFPQRPKSVIPETIYPLPENPDYSFSLWMNADPLFYYKGKKLGINTGAERLVPRPITVEVWGAQKKRKWWFETSLEITGGRMFLEQVIAAATDPAAPPSRFPAAESALRRILAEEKSSPKD
jgi:hypothetical protein